MRVPLDVWETVAVIINNEFVSTGDFITADLLVKLVVGVSEDYYDEETD